MTKEKRVYVISRDEDLDFLHCELFGEHNKIMDKAKELGSVYSLRGFQDAINDESLWLTNSFILIA